MTFADIAKYTNFSKTTISRYLIILSPSLLENQEKIAKALDEWDIRKINLQKSLQMEKVNL